MKERLIFDTTDANTIADSDSVGAFLRASDGTLIDKATIGGVDRLAVDSTLKDGSGTALTSSAVGGSQALDVKVVEGINVEVDLSHVDDSVRLGDGTDFFTSTTVGADIGLDVNLINSSIAVTASDLDIRDLAFATDKVDVSGSSVTVSATDLDIRDLAFATDKVDVSGSSVTVSATDLDIRNLAHTQDSVRLGDGTSFYTSTTIGADVGLDVNVINSIQTSDAALANVAIASAAETLDVASTAQDAVAAPLSNRKYLFIMNNDNRTMYIGGAGVTESDGYPVSVGASIELRAGAAVDVQFVSSKLNHAIRTLELS